MSKIGQGRRGRPHGFRLSEESRRAISESKRGQKHRQETKDKISKSLIVYFRNQNPLSEEIADMYCSFEDDEVRCWMDLNGIELDSSRDIMTIKTLRNARRIELSWGDPIEFFGHEVTPELLVLFKEVCEEKGKDPMEFFDDLGYKEGE